MKKIFTIPVGEISKEEAEASILELMKDYHEDVMWDESIDVMLDDDNKLKVKDDNDVWIPYKVYDPNENK
jgi:hypothetical protein